MNHGGAACHTHMRLMLNNLFSMRRKRPWTVSLRLDRLAPVVPIRPAPLRRIAAGAWWPISSMTRPFLLRFRTRSTVVKNSSS